MQIDIDFEVFKSLTALRLSETDSYNAVIRRLIGLPNANSLAAFSEVPPPKVPVGVVNALASIGSKAGRRGPFGLDARDGNAHATREAPGGLLGIYSGGTWLGNVHFPEGTRFRATYKGQTYHAEIQGGQWIGADGKTRRSPSDAASAISGNNVNGWRFWYVQMPGDPSWRKLDELKQ